MLDSDRVLVHGRAGTCCGCCACCSAVPEQAAAGVGRLTLDQRSPLPARPPACSCDDIWLPHFEFINVRGFSQVSNPPVQEGTKQMARLLSSECEAPPPLDVCPPRHLPTTCTSLSLHLPVPPKQDRVVRYGVRVPSDSSSDAVGWWVHIQVRRGTCFCFGWHDGICIPSRSVLWCSQATPRQ